jgi:hypothetical protein
MKITARCATIGDLAKDDQENFIAWVWAARAINAFDPKVISYPRTIMLTADKEVKGCPTEPILYLPVQPVLMLESLAPKPGISPHEEAAALGRFGELLEQISKETGIQEQYFLCKDDRVADLCVKHGFTEMKDYRLLQRKIPYVPVKPVTLDTPATTEE